MRLAPLFEQFGCVVEATGESLALLAGEAVHAAMRHHGVVLLRGFHADTASFEAFSRRMCDAFYIHPDPKRVAVGLDGFTHLASPGQRAIKLHAERMYEPAFARPQLLWFHCLRPASSDGETLLCDGAELWARLPPRIQALFTRNRLLYLLVLPSKPLRGDWPRHFATSLCEIVSPADAEVVMQAHADLEYAFLDSGKILVLKHLVAAALPCRFGGRAAFANNLLTRHFSSVVQLEDFTAIPEDVLCEIEHHAAPITFPIPWQAGDVVVLNNERVLHGRRSHDDPQRLLHVRLGRDRMSFS